MAIKDLAQYSGLMSVKTTMKFLDCSRTSIYAMIKDGYLIPVGRKGFWRFRPEQIIAGMNRMTKEHRRFKVEKELI